MGPAPGRRHSARSALQPLRESAEAFGTRIKDEVARWGPIVKSTGFTPED